nr:hypothetical protein [Tanacetum cinerariifolium]
MEAPVISISSDSSDESVGSVMPWVILFSTILTEVPVVPADLPVAPEVRAAVIASPAGVLELESHSSSETGLSESLLRPLPVAPTVSPFMCSYDSESEPAVVLPKRHVSSTAHDAMVGRWRTPSAFITPATDIISPIDAPPGFSRRSVVLIRPRQAILSTEPTAPILMGRVRYDFTSDSPLNSSSDSSFDHSLSDHSQSDHSPKDSTEEDIDAGVSTDVEAGTDVGVGIEIDEGLDVAMQQLYDHMGEILVDRIVSIETGQRQLEADSMIANVERAGLSSRVVVLERSNTRLH